MNSSRTHTCRTAAAVLAGAIALAAILPSCSKVHFKNYDPESGLAPGSSYVRLCVDWSDAGVQQPCAMSAALARRINEVHYTASIEPDGTTLAVKDGEYSILAFGCGGGDDVPDYIFHGLEDFDADSRVSLRSLYASMPEISGESLQSLFEGEEIPFMDDRIILDATPFWLASTKAVIDGGADTTKVILQPRASFLSEVTVRISMTVDEGVSVGRVFGMLSGVPHGIQMLSGCVERDSIATAFFPMEKAADSPADSDVKMYEGRIRVLGLFPALYSESLYGAGIFHIALNVRSGDSNARLIEARMNLKSKIEESGMMTSGDNGVSYRLVKDAVTFDIQSTIEISADAVTFSGEDAAEKWVLATELEIEV